MSTDPQAIADRILAHAEALVAATEAYTTTGLALLDSDAADDDRLIREHDNAYQAMLTERVLISALTAILRGENG